MGEKLLKWVAWADKDYLAARKLLLENYLVQGTCIANTAVEKYLKAVILYTGNEIPHSHNLVDLKRRVADYGVELNLNSEFIELLYKAYRLRYPENLPVQYNIGLCLTKILSELDDTVFAIRSGFEFNSVKGEIVTLLDKLITENDVNLLSKNCRYGIQDRKQFFQETSFCHDLRVLDGGNLLEAEYQTNGCVDDKKFLKEALSPS